MTAAVARRLMAGTGGLQVLLNLLTLARGLPRVRGETAAGALYYLVLGPALYLTGLRRHAGLFVFSLLGLLVLGALRFGRA